MMVLTDGLNDEVCFTLNELVTLESPEFVIIFVHDDTKKKVACKLVSDTSDFPDRYNKYEITVKASPVPANGEVFLENKGFHKYYVYEIADADAFDFAGVDSMVLENLSGLVERGKMFYAVTPAEIEHYKNNASSIKAYA